MQTWALTLGSAILFLGFYCLNDWFFSNLIYRDGVNWIFLPAGFRIILVLVLGLKGALGIVLGSLFISRELFNQNWGDVALVNALLSGFTPWLVMKVMVHRRTLSLNLGQLTSQELLNFTLIYAAASAWLHQASWSMMGWRDVNLWVDVWPMFVGDTLGALIMLYGMKWLTAHLQTTPVPK